MQNRICHKGDNNLLESTVSDINVADIPILYINISGNYDLKKLKEYADNLKDDIEAMKEISKVEEVGALKPNIQINVDMNKMAAAQIGYNDIIQAVGSENIMSSAGTIKTDGMQRAIDIKEDFKNADEVAAMVIRNPQGKAVYLRDIAEVKDAFQDQQSYARLKTNSDPNFKNVITLNVSKRSGENLIQASDKINSLIAQKEKTVFPKGLNITVTGDQSDKTRTTLNDLINTIIIGFISGYNHSDVLYGKYQRHICGLVGTVILFHRLPAYAGDRFHIEYDRTVLLPTGAGDSRG